ncbi:MAG: ISL3 family transposase, partial [Egibacteraceae bacterium]
VRPKRPKKRRCGRCGRPAPREDAGEGRRLWRSLDLGTVKVFLGADAPRVRCGEHGVMVAQVPWARHGARQTRALEDTAAWLVTQCSKTAVSGLLRIAWRTVGSIVTRVVGEIDGRVDRFAGLKRIGIDEISYKRGHKYLTVVVDHDTRRLVWAAVGRDEKTLQRFFDALGEQRCAQITHVSADAADWIANVVADRCKNATRCADPFPIVKWATEALDEVRRQAWNDARGAVNQRKAGRSTGTARALKRSRYALWKNPQDLTDRQRAKLAWIAKTDPRLHRAYLLKEGLRHAFVLKGQAGKDALDRWTAWAQRCRIPAFVELQRRIRRHRGAIDAALEHGLSQGLIESTNTKIRVLTRVAFGFRSPEALIALAMLALGGYRPSLPGRTATR